MTKAFFFNDTATTEIYTLSLHDALPILSRSGRTRSFARPTAASRNYSRAAMCLQCSLMENFSSATWRSTDRSEEHTSELQSRQYLVCRLLLEKKNYSRSLISPC